MTDRKTSLDAVTGAQCPEARAIAEDLLTTELPGGVARRAPFAWRYGKCDGRHWSEAHGRLATYLKEAARDARGERGLDREWSERTFAGVNWILDFMREIVEHAGEGSAVFPHGDAAVPWLETHQTCESALRLLAAATRRSVVGKTMRHEYFTSDAFKRVRTLLSMIEDSNLNTCEEYSILDPDIHTEELCDNGRHTFSSELSCHFTVTWDPDMDGGSLTLSAYYGEFNLPIVPEPLHFDVEIAAGEWPDEQKMLNDLMRRADKMVQSDFWAAPLEKWGISHEEFANGAALAIFQAKMRTWKRVLRSTREGRETCACLAVLAHQIIIHLGKTQDATEFDRFTENAQTHVIVLLELMENNLALKTSSMLRRDATNCMSAFANERICGFHVCQILRRAAGRDSLYQCVSTMASNLLSAGESGALSFDLIRDARSLMHLIGILSTSTPGCAAIRDANLLPLLVSMLNVERAEAVPVTVDVVHTIESYLDFQPNTVPAFRDLQGVELISKRMRQEALACVEELKIAGCLDENGDRKRKADSLSSLEHAEASCAPSTSEVPRKYADYDRRVLLKALMRTLAYTSFSHGGTRMRIPGLADGSLTDTLATILKYPLRFGPGVSSLAANLLCDVIHNEPTCYATLDDAGIIDAFLKLITETMWPLGRGKHMAKVLCALPTTISAICLNGKGQEKVLQTSALICFRKMFQDASFPLNSDTAKVVGSGINETLRHSPALKDVGVDIVTKILADLQTASHKTTSAEGWYEHAFVSKEVVEQMPIVKAMHNVARFLDGILQTSHVCSPIVRAGGLESVLDIFTCPMPVEFMQCSSYQAICVACKALVNPIDGHVVNGNPLESQDNLMRACRSVIKKFVLSSERLSQELMRFSDTTSRDGRIETFSSYDIHCR